MHQSLIVLLLVLMVCTMGTVIFGIWKMKSSNTKNAKLQNNKLMFLRVILQALAIIVVLILYTMSKH